jgi:hypothetical protein
MRPITDSGRFLQPITGQIHDTAPAQVNQEILIRVTGLINLGVSLLDLLIVLRYLLNLLDASPLQPFAGMIYRMSEPFVAVFQGLTRLPLFQDMALELNTLIAILAYSLLGWIAIRLIRILFASLN